MKISQREAHRLRKRVLALEMAEDARRWRWTDGWPGGTAIAEHAYVDRYACVPVTLRTARMLGHAVVAVCDEAKVTFFALPLGGAKR